ncbi:MAG: hypothetical protein AAI902_00365 [Candidatus Hodgkinia cicadicola]
MNCDTWGKCTLWGIVIKLMFLALTFGLLGIQLERWWTPITSAADPVFSTSFVCDAHDQGCLETAE